MSSTRGLGGSTSTARDQAAGLARRANDSTALEGLARTGYAVSGLLHLLIAWIALQIAFGTGGGGKNADQSGALGTLAQNGFGKLLLWVGVVGFLGLALWQLTEAVRVLGWPTSDGKRKAGSVGKSVAKGATYLVIGLSALQYAKGGAGSSGRAQAQDFTAQLMAKPFGRTLVVVVGLVVIGVAVYHVVKGVKKKFLQDLQEHPGHVAVRLGTAGYVAKGVALGIVGGLFVVAGWHKQPSQASGLDGALRTLREAPFGTVLLVLVALGIAAYGVYSFARARHARV